MNKAKNILFSMLVPLIIVGLVCVIAYFACGVGITSNDCFEQYIPFFGAYYDVLTEGKSMFFSSTGALGYDFWAVFAYYLVSPLNLIIVFFDKADLIYAIEIIMIIKVVLCGGSFATFISNRYPKSNAGRVVLFSTIYALSGYMVGYMWNVMWLDGLVLFPLIIMGLDMLMRKERPQWFLYTAFLAMTIVTCYFMGYIICIFIFMYFFTYRFENFKDFMKKFLRIGLSSLLAIGLSAIILLPAFMSLRATAINNEVLPGMELYGSFVDSFKTIMVGVPAHGVSFDREEANLFISTFGLLLVFEYFVSKSIKLSDKIRNAVLLLILFASFNFKLPNFIWHGFHEQYGIPNRFSFEVIFLFLIMGFEVCAQKRSKITKRSLFIAWGILCTCLTVMAVLKNELIINAALTAVLALVYVFILGFGQGRMKFNAVRILALAEIVITFIVAIFNATGVVMGDYGKYSEAFQNINLKKEKGVYREKLDKVYNERQIYYRNVMCYMSFEDFGPREILNFMEYTKNVGHQGVINEATYYGLNSMYMFSTLHNYNLSHFYNKVGGTGGNSSSVYYGENAFMDMLLGVRYYYTRYEPVNSSTYVYVGNEDGVNIYRNRYELSIGYAVPDEFFEAELKYNPFTSMNNISHSIVGNDVFRYSAFVYNSTNEYGEKIYTCTPAVTGEVLLKVDYGYVKDIHIWVGDKLVYEGCNEQVVLSAGMVNAGEKITLKVSFQTGKTPSYDFPIYVATLNQSVFENVYKELSKEQLMVSSYNDTFWQGSITLSEASKVLITVPTAKGYEVYVDGVKTEYEEYENLFYVLNLEKGTHVVTFEYETPGFELGCMVSLISIGIYMVALTVTVLVRRKQICQEDDN